MPYCFAIRFFDKRDLFCMGQCKVFAQLENLQLALQIHVYDPYLQIVHNLPSLNLIYVANQCLLAYSISDF